MCFNCYLERILSHNLNHVHSPALFLYVMFFKKIHFFAERKFYGAIWKPYAYARRWFFVWISDLCIKLMRFDVKLVISIDFTCIYQFFRQKETEMWRLEPAVNRQPGFRRGAVEQTRPPSAREQTREPTSRPRTDRKSHRSRGILLSWLVAGLRLGGLVAWWLRGSVARWLGGLWFGGSTAWWYTSKWLDDSMA